MKVTITRRAAVLAGLILGVLTLGGCATKTPVSGSFPDISPRSAQSEKYRGQTVRWGGILIDTSPEAGATCFRVMGLPLAGNGRPEMGRGVAESGRFLACADGFYDPVLYAAGRQITFIGTITGVVHETVGKYKYPYPRLAARVVYLWPENSTYSATRVYYGGYYGWGPGWWGPGVWTGYPWWGFPPPYLPPPRNPPPHHGPPPPPAPPPPPPPRTPRPHRPPLPTQPPNTKPPRS